MDSLRPAFMFVHLTNKFNGLFESHLVETTSKDQEYFGGQETASRWNR
jgi:hypothetical protein